MSINLLLRQGAARTVARPLIARSQARCFSSTPFRSASGPSGAEVSLACCMLSPLSL